MLLLFLFKLISRQAIIHFSQQSQTGAARPRCHRSAMSNYYGRASYWDDRYTK